MRGRGLRSEAAPGAAATTPVLRRSLFCNMGRQVGAHADVYEEQKTIVMNDRHENNGALEATPCGETDPQCQLCKQMKEMRVVTTDRNVSRALRQLRYDISVAR